jgi:hypothetical protein
LLHFALYEDSKNYFSQLLAMTAKILNCHGCVGAKQNTRLGMLHESTMPEPSVGGILKSDLSERKFWPFEIRHWSFALY